MECKKEISDKAKQELIDTLWNVNAIQAIAGVPAFAN